MTAKNDTKPPVQLQRLRRWCRWRTETPPGGSPTKRPLQSTKDTGACLTYADAVAAGPVDRTQGVGFVWTGGVEIDGARLLALDIDACRDPVSGEITDWALEILGAHDNNTTEITPSGTGLRQWLLVGRPPEALLRTKVDVPAAAPPGVFKKPNVQLFGMGAAQFTTVTGEHLRGTSETLRRIGSIDWLIDKLGLGRADAADVAMPVGDGTPPSIDVVERRVRKVNAKLVDGEWASAGGSASEAFFVLVQHAIRCSDGFGEVALEFLLARTAWGRGEVKGSKDASRYARESWVRAEVMRVAAKRAPTPAAFVFDDGADFGPAPPASTGLIYRDLGEFFAGEDADEFLVHGVIPRMGIVQVFGDPGSGKTPFALSLAIHVAGGLPDWFGHRIDRHGPVVYMIGEGAAGLRKRVRAELQLHSLDGSQVRLLPTKRPGRLTDVDEAELWVREVQAAAPGGCAMLVVDTQSMNFGPANENASEDMQRFVDHLTALSKRLRCVVVLVHHTGHANKERGRGSSVMFGAVDATFEVSREGRAVTATPGKVKDWEAPEPLAGTLEVFEVRKDREGRPVTAVCLRTSPPTPGEVFDDLEGVFAGDDLLERVLKDVAARDGVATPVRQIAEAVAASEKEVRARLSRLESLGLLTIEGNRRVKSGLSYVLTAKGLTLRPQWKGEESVNDLTWLVS